MSRRSSGPAVALFPFLAVLLCAMGALILLLLILTREIREDATHSAFAVPVEVPQRPESIPVVTVTLPPVVAGGTVFFLTDDGDLLAYR